MAISKRKNKKSLLYARHEGDTGSIEKYKLLSLREYYERTSNEKKHKKRPYLRGLMKIGRRRNFVGLPSLQETTLTVTVISSYGLRR